MIATEEIRRFFPDLPDEDIAFAARYARSVTFEKDSYIHRGEDDCTGVILIQRGRVRVYMLSEDGREITLFRLRAGDACTLSASCVLDEITFSVMIVTEEQVAALVIPLTAVEQLLSRSPAFARDLYKWTTEKFSAVMWAMQQILFRSFDKRLAAFLLSEAGGEERVCLTHEQIAKYLGSAREVVSRMLKYFEAEGAVTLGRGNITIADRKLLRKWAQ